MAEVCKDINEWIEEEVAKPVENWVANLEKKCQEQDCNWWCLCCNKWFCWLVVIIVKVVTWIIVTVGKWVVRTVCETIATVVDFIEDVIVGGFDILVGIFTWDWARVWDGFERIVVGAVTFGVGIFRIASFGDTIDFIREEVNKSRLRNYVKDLLEKKYGDQEEVLEAIKDALGIDAGAFGFRIKAKALRTFVRSDAISGHQVVPDLILWHEDSNLDIDIKEMAGYDYSEFWRRFRPEVVADSGGFSESDMDNYISSRGLKGKSFSIFSVKTGVLDTKLNTAEEKGRDLGLLFKWSVEDVQVTKPEYVRHHGFDTGTSNSNLENFLVEIGGRTKKSIDLNKAVSDLCTVMGGAVFFYTDNLNGLSAHLFDHTCLDGSNFSDSDVSGVTFKDRRPDYIWKFVPIHEIGHYFGLCHVSGLDRIMYSGSAKSKSWFRGWTFPEYLYLEGGPSFTYDEAKSVWRYIVKHFSADCLSSRAD